MARAAETVEFQKELGTGKGHAVPLSHVAKGRGRWRGQRGDFNMCVWGAGAGSRMLLLAMGPRAARPAEGGLEGMERHSCIPVNGTQTHADTQKPRVGPVEGGSHWDSWSSSKYGAIKDAGVTAHPGHRTPPVKRGARGNSLPWRRCARGGRSQRDGSFSPHSEISMEHPGVPGAELGSRGWGHSPHLCQYSLQIWTDLGCLSEESGNNESTTDGLENGPDCIMVLALTSHLGLSPAPPRRAAKPGHVALPTAVQPSAEERLAPQAEIRELDKDAKSNRSRLFSSPRLKPSRGVTGKSW
uniref:Uncharacterized protein n=1 Tax=Rangifer tarandus platyrhynchus TaxID=3082113 RepID=A0ACB0FFI1_RANTA|nr:unnamed protein product [Rangifer tarandus platyrhynchus]